MWSFRSESMCGRRAGNHRRGRGVPRIYGTQVTAVHFLADLERPLGKLKGPLPAGPFGRRIDPIFLSHHRMTAEDIPAASPLGLARPASPSGYAGGVLIKRAHDTRLATQVDSEMIDKGLWWSRIGSLILLRNWN